MLINSGDLLRSRLQYFPESSQLAKKYVQHLITDRQLEYNDTKEFRDNCKMGFVYFILTCIADFYISNL